MSAASNIARRSDIDRHVEQATRMMSLVERAFLAEMGWDPDRLVLNPPDGHRLVIRAVCRVEGCSNTATAAGRICVSCRRRLQAPGLGEAAVVSLGPPRRPRRAPQRRLVAGCGREQVSGPAGLCRSHLDQRTALGVSAEAFFVHPAVAALEPTGPCLVAACPRQRHHPDSRYCEAHQIRLRAARRDPRFDEARWQGTEPAVSLGGQVSLRGLGPLVVAQVLFGLQQRCVVERVQTKEADLRAVCDDLRRQQVASVANYLLDDRRNLGFCGLVRSLVSHARRALATPRDRGRRR
jgi:hypothetical protein